MEWSVFARVGPEEFLPLLVTTILSAEVRNLDVSFGPVTSFSALRFDSAITSQHTGAGMTIRSKDQDFAISRRLFIQSSFQPDFEDAVTQETNIAYVAAETKTNLDKTMFQEAAATALDVKSVVPGARYYLLCEWLDMTPISTATTAIAEIMILRKCTRLQAGVRRQFSTAEGRKQNRAGFVQYLASHPISWEILSRFLGFIRELASDEQEEDVVNRGYF